MATEPVTADQYPHLRTFELRSDRGSAEFIGEVVRVEAACSTCGGPATVYRGPQYGLAVVPDVEQELTWCPRCGADGSRLVRPDGTEYAGL